MSLTRLTARINYMYIHMAQAHAHTILNGNMRTQSNTINYLLLANPAGESACDARHLLLPLLTLHDYGCL